WRFQTAGAIYGAPVLADGMVYFGSADRKLYALNAETGGLVWAFPAPDVITGSPALAEGTLYFGCEDRSVYALNARTGSLRWKMATGGPVAATPALDADTVYVGSDDGGVIGRAVPAGDLVYVPSYDNHLYALEVNPERRVGQARWSYNAYDAVKYAPTVAAG